MNDRDKRLVQLKAHAESGKFLTFSFVKGSGEVIGGCTLQYPEQGQGVVEVGQPTHMEERAQQANDALIEFNSLLDQWCS